MKNYLSKIFVVLILLTTVNSCTTRDTVVDEVLDGVINGAVLRTILLIENELPIGIPTAKFSVLIEEQDEQDGALLQDVNVYNSFNDLSAGTSTAEVLMMNIPAAGFSTDTPFGLPRVTIEITLVEMLAAHGLTDADLFGGDVFNTRLELNLTDGRTYSVNDAAGIITGGFFSSPFQYNTTVICPVDPTFAVGDYIITQIAPSIFGVPTWGDPEPTTVIGPDGGNGLTSTQRQFSEVYLPAFGIGQAPASFTFDFICGNINPLPGQGSGLTCGNGGITLGPPVGIPAETYSPLDDTTFRISFRDDEIDDCGGGVDAVVELNRQ